MPSFVVSAFRLLTYPVVSLVGLFTTAIAVLPATGQGSKEDYERADNIGQRWSGKVVRDKVSPNWIDESSRFWYRVRTGPDAHEFVFVDPGKDSARSKAFDHEALAAAVAEATGKEVDANKLPFDKIEYVHDGTTIAFSAHGKGFEWDLLEGTLRDRSEGEAKPKKNNGTTVNVLPYVRKATWAGESTEIRFINKTGGKILLFWVSNPDKPTPYGSVEAGAQYDRHTFAGHVWLVTDENEKPLGVFEATTAPGVAVVDGSWKPGKPPRAPRRRDRPEPNKVETADSPDGKWRAELREHNLFLVDKSNDNEATQLTFDGSPRDAFRSSLFWSPDSKKLAAIQERKAEKRIVHFVESAPKGQLQPVLQSFDYVKPGDPLDHPRPRLFDIGSKKEVPVSQELFSNPWRLSDFRWERDSSRFSFLYNQRGHQVLRLVGIDASTGEASTIVEETPETFVCYSSKSFYRPLEDTNEIIWMSERDGWNHLYLFDAKSGALKNQITKGEWVVRKVDRVDTEKRQIWFQAGGIHPGQDPYHVHYCRVDFDGTNLVKLTGGDGTHSITYSPDGEHLIASYSRVDLPPITELRRVGDGSLIAELEEGDASELVDAGWQRPERFVAKGRDGKTDIHGIILRPSNFDPSVSYPVIEHIYAGPHSSHVPKRFSTGHGGQSIAELGFVVVRIDGMGTSNRSKAFHDVCWQDIGDAGFPDRVLWIKAAAESRPWMDLSRVGIYGGSAGGQNAMRAIIAHNDFYHVAVADCGCHDNRMDKIWWNEQWMGYPIDEHYSASSNVDQAHRLKGKLLLIVGELDRNVDPASTMQVVDALIKADKDFDLVVIPGAGHGAAGSPYGRRRQRDFFVRHLLEVEPRH